VTKTVHYFGQKKAKMALATGISKIINNKKIISK